MDITTGGDADVARLAGRSPRTESDGPTRGVTSGTWLGTGGRPPNRARALCGASTAEPPPRRRAPSVDLVMSLGVDGNLALYAAPAVEEVGADERFADEGVPPPDNGSFAYTLCLKGPGVVVLGRECEPGGGVGLLPDMSSGAWP